MPYVAPRAIGSAQGRTVWPDRFLKVTRALVKKEQHPGAQKTAKREGSGVLHTAAVDLAAIEHALASKAVKGAHLAASGASTMGHFLSAGMSRIFQGKAGSSAPAPQQKLYTADGSQGTTPFMSSAAKDQVPAYDSGGGGAHVG